MPRSFRGRLLTQVHPPLLWGKPSDRGRFLLHQALREAGVQEGGTPVSTLPTAPGLCLPPHCGREPGEEPQKPPKCLNLQTLKIVAKSMHTSPRAVLTGPFVEPHLLNSLPHGRMGLQEVVADDPPGGRRKQTQVFNFSKSC